jgi:hypothetical protein
MSVAHFPTIRLFDLHNRRRMRSTLKFDAHDLLTIYPLHLIFGQRTAIVPALLLVVGLQTLSILMTSVGAYLNRDRSRIRRPPAARAHGVFTVLDPALQSTCTVQASTNA